MQVQVGEAGMGPHATVSKIAVPHHFMKEIMMQSVSEAK
jgi:hypothetical protein